MTSWRRNRGRHKARCKGDVEKDIRKMAIVNWRKAELERDGGRRATGEALILLG